MIAKNFFFDLQPDKKLRSGLYEKNHPTLETSHLSEILAECSVSLCKNKSFIWEWVHPTQVRSHLNVGEISLRWNDFSPCKQFWLGCSTWGRTFYSLLVTFYSFLITFYSLLVTFYSLLVPFYSLLITCYSLLFSLYSLPVTTYSVLFTFHSSLLIRYSVLFTRYFCSLISAIYLLNFGKEAECC